MTDTISISILVSLILISIALMTTGFRINNKALKIISYFTSFLSYITMLNLIFNIIVPF